jgi:hypothetical protein
MLRSSFRVLAVLALTLDAAPAGAQTPNPVVAALRAQLKTAERNFTASAERMPADKYGYRPTDAIVTHVRDSFAFCTSALAILDDSHLGETVSLFGSQITRASAILILSGDWSDHYAVTATYLPLNGILPPTARS